MSLLHSTAMWLLSSFFPQSLSLVVVQKRIIRQHKQAQGHTPNDIIFNVNVGHRILTLVLTHTSLDNIPASDYGVCVKWPPRAESDRPLKWSLLASVCSAASSLIHGPVFSGSKQPRKIHQTLLLTQADGRKEEECWSSVTALMWQ